jgi:glutamine amidotransferase
MEYAPFPPRRVGHRRRADAGGESVYFVHSFYCQPAEPGLVLADCDYGGAFPAMIAFGRNGFAAQFHPEKSQATGLRIYRNFALQALRN